MAARQSLGGRFPGGNVRLGFRVGARIGSDHFSVGQLIFQ
jgi:hypothetical protein